MSIVTEFKEFIFRGNVVELAVAVIMAVAFGAVVTSLVEDLMTPLIAAIVGEPDFSAITFRINDSVFRIGSFINSVIAFLCIAVVIFLAVVKPMNAMVERSRREPTPDPSTQKCPECRSEIPLDATRCAFCTVEVAGARLR